MFKIDGFENPPLKIDGFGRTPRTRANVAPAKKLGAAATMPQNFELDRSILFALIAHKCKTVLRI